MKEDLLFDKRLIERHKKKGLLDNERVTRHFDTLEDRADKAVPLNAERQRERHNEG